MTRSDLIKELKKIGWKDPAVLIADFFPKLKRYSIPEPGHPEYGLSYLVEDSEGNWCQYDDVIETLFANDPQPLQMWEKPCKEAIMRIFGRYELTEAIDRMQAFNAYLYDGIDA